MNAKDFWARVKALLKEHGMTQKQLSLSIGCSERSVDIWIAKDNVPGVFEAYKIAEKLNTSVEYLVTGHDRMLTLDSSKLGQILEQNLTTLFHNEITKEES